MIDLLARCRRGKPLGIDGIVDMHGHVGRYGYPIPDLSPEGLLSVMNRVGVQTIICSHMQCMSGDAEWGNAEVLEFQKADRQRLLAYVSVFPRSPDHVRASTLRWLKIGFAGIKLHDANGFPYDDPAYVPALELAHERSLPVLLHTWGKAGQLRAAVDISKRYPNISLLLAHSGCVNSEAYVQAVREAPNIFLDTTFSRCPRGLIERLVREVGVHRVVWGSDCFFYSMTQQIGKVLSARISDAHKKAILVDNAQAILGKAEIEKPG